MFDKFVLSLVANIIIIIIMRCTQVQTHWNVSQQSTKKHYYFHENTDLIIYGDQFLISPSETKKYPLYFPFNKVTKIYLDMVHK